LAKYTISVSTLIKNGFDFGLENYPIFDENYREPLNLKLIEHYYEYEIGSETTALFKFRLNRAMNEIMVEFNQLYESKLLSIDPLLSFKTTKTLIDEKNQNSSSTQRVESDGTITTDGTVKNTGTTTTDGESTSNIDNTTLSKNVGVSSDMPQTELLLGDLENNLYASDANVDKNDVVVDENRVNKDDVTVTQDLTNKNDSSVVSGNDTNSTSTLLNTETNNQTGSEEGFNVSQSELLLQYRETIIDIDRMVLNHPLIKSCFMLVF